MLADSNIDWGQNRERLGRWLAEREWSAARVAPVHLLPGRNVIDLNALAGGARRTEAVSLGQEVWWRLEPGTHALCLVAQPNRRPWLPYRLDDS